MNSRDVKKLEIKGHGSKVQIRVVPTVNIGDYSVNGQISYQDLDDSKITLTIDKAKYFAFKIDDVDQAQADINIMNEATKDASKNMANVIEQAVFASIYADATTQPASTQLTKTNILDYIVDRGVELDVLNVPMEGRWMVLPPWAVGLILKSDIKDASLAGDSTSVMRTGRVGVIDSFTIYKSNNLTGAGTVGSPTHGLAGTKHGISFASQFTKVETLRLQDTFGDAVRGLNVFGFAASKPGALIDLEIYQ